MNILRKMVQVLYVLRRRLKRALLLWVALVVCSLLADNGLLSSAQYLSCTKMTKADEMSFSNYMHSGVKKRNVLNL